MVQTSTLWGNKSGDEGRPDDPVGRGEAIEFIIQLPVNDSV
jgi:hypothetical protein